ncbi:Leu/Phe/Val dehydrogenase [Moritella viscosa]|uniref:Glu/Leu/Phe/Val dehydrogenase n=1 Tax=Moritella viscosa TaxID=80854 RepID=A0A1L0APR5_9GAMM|nr:Glu/Leu/Phe/Val dehydrogenase dimerization domain-containing protein [Moritella viscosa]SGZ16612.1 Glu/Leu/Phe/Val dehydrogenase [Moritella viscosa]SHO02226.1 Glu/Leu/Phe/Val dehydrogenase [Moritella viscosa]SHO02376.1 Glu/Leu/Phe/Val dehydrogenase [Moritella viscosa]SHO06987.1 Glu/Leu/Phe/Val dehydrogenase [Moritella viscosa]SHO17816.1 Glu/Leu/Phe/Val dehydrogenase [Moritella viscosa]
MTSFIESTDLFDMAEQYPFSDVHFWRDPETQLQAIIAIHSTQLGPAIGGCRMINYPSTQAAVKDVCCLAAGMSYKTAINRLPFGGGKAVIIKPAHLTDRKALFTSFGRFVESLNGRYITAMDSGTTIDDMDIIASQTKHVMCTTTAGLASGDPSPHTAKGVYYGIKAAVKFKLQQESLAGLHIAIQGVGNVGYALAKLLHNDGARLTVADPNKEATQRLINEFDVDVVAGDELYAVHCDVFSPCALGQVINTNSIARLNASIIAGSANNQLQSRSVIDALTAKGILYAPDYVINSGGVLQISYLNNPDVLQRKLAALYGTLLDIFTQAEQQNSSTVDVANSLAEKILTEPFAGANYE